MHNQISSQKLLCILLLLPVFFVGKASTADPLGAAGNWIVDVENEPLLNTQGMVEDQGYLQHGQSSLITDGSDTAFLELTLAVPQQGYYRLYAWWPLIRKSAVPPVAEYLVSSGGNQTIVTLDQTTGAGQWQSLGDFSALQENSFTIRIQGQQFAADAIRVSYLGVESPSPEILTKNMEIGTVRQPYSFHLQATGGTSNYSWDMVSALPRGLSLNAATGEISGTPDDHGQHTLELYLTDGSGATTSAEISFVIVDEESLKNTTKASGSIQSSTKSLGLNTTQSINASTPTSTLLEDVTSMPEGTWKKVNNNLFSDVWAPAELRPYKGGASNPTPHKIIAAWSSFAWDFHKGVLFAYGGGHANYSGNDVYLWRSSTREWERASLPSEIVQDSLGNFRAIDGVLAAPSSAHTYDNNVYLPVAKKFMIYGGAAYDNGGAFKMELSPSTDRATGPYVFDPALANPWQVGGTTGSHVQRVSPHPEVTGGNMWSNRDIYDNISGTPPLPSNFVMATTSVTIENGYDVVYVNAKSGGSARQLYKHTIRDIDDPTLDTWEQVGKYFNSYGKQAAGAFSPASNVYVRAGNSFVYWDLTNPGSGNRNQIFVPEDSSGEFEISNNYGFDYFPLHNRFLMWDGDSEVWSLEPPASMSTQGWKITRETTGTLPAPNGYIGTGILGKWEFAPDLNAFVGLQDADDGNVWIYKPVGWQPPGTVNQSPSISFVQPQQAEQFLDGDSISLAVTATDIDGQVDLVEFFDGSTKIGEDSAPPYDLTWVNASVGSHSLSARATDNLGSSTNTASLLITIVGENTPPSTSITYPINGNELLTGSTITITAAATDIDSGIEKVEFFSGAQKLGEDTSAPYNLLWLVPAPGQLVLTTKAIDNDGLNTTSSTVAITVLAGNNAPEVTLLNPASGANFVAGETLSLQASAIDTDGSIARVEFYSGATRLGIDTSEPYTYDWTNATPGSYTLLAKAIDNANASANSEAASVTVNSGTGGEATLVTLQDGLNAYTGTRDAYLSSYHPNNALGKQGLLQDKTNRYVGLIKFAIFQSEGGPIPNGASIESATVGFYKYSTYSHEYQLHRMLADWVEDEVTWNDSNDGSSWGSSGAGASGVDYASVTESNGAAAWPAGWLDIDVTSGVQAISQGELNYGWRLIPVSGNKNVKRFYSRETMTDTTLRPRLTIQYTFGGNTSPLVALSAPVEAEQYEAGDIITIAAEASDTDGSIERVEFYASGSKIGEDNLAPYSFDWQNTVPGEYSLTAKVVDDLGAVGFSTPISISVIDDNIAPEVSLSNPLEGENFLAGDTVSILADALDTDGSIAKVEFYNGTTKLGEASMPPYRYDWTGALTGNYSLYARAVDNEGATASSASVQINVTDTSGSIQVILQDGRNGYSGTRDTYISSYHKNNKYGAQSFLRDKRTRYVSLLKFAIFQSEGGPVPDSAIIESAVLGVYKYSSYNHQYQVHEISVGWNEDEASWNESKSGIAWDSAGANGAGVDYDASINGSGSIAWPAGWLEIDLTQSVQGMNQGQENQGWRLTPVGGNKNEKRFYSRESISGNDLRPKLSIRYR